MKSFILAVVAVVLALLASDLTPVARAQSAGSSSGAYTTYIGAQPVGTESYTLTEGADGSRRSEADVAFGVSKSKAVTVASKDGPRSFHVEQGGAKVLSAEFGAGVVKISAAGQPEREVKTEARVVLENGIWHQFIYLLAQYDAARGGPQTFKAFLPSQATEYSITVERTDAPAFNVKGRKVETEHYRAVTGQNLVVEVWADAARVPLLLRVPSQGIKAVRKDAEELAAVIIPPPADAAPGSDAAFTSEEVTFQNGGVRLAGTLTVPKKGSAPFPAAVIITGSGGQDRDGANGLFNFYRLIAERLSEAGVAVLRADDRGVGKSTMPADLKAVSYRDLINDSRAAFEYLLSRPDIDKKRVALVGHSEGAETAITLAAEDARVAAVAVLAGSSRPVDRIVVEQALYQVALQEAVDPSDTQKLPQITRDLLKGFEEAQSGRNVPGAAVDLSAWFREHAASNPSETIKRVRVPVIILNGERDTLVLPYHAIELAQAAARAGNRRVSVRIFPNLTHLFTPSTLDAGVQGERATEVSTEFLRTLQAWAADVLVKGAEAGARKATP